MSTEISDPEKNAMVYSLLEKLTVEAKCLLYIIFETPGELSTLLFGNGATKNTEHIKRWERKNKLNKQSVKKYFKAIDKTVDREPVYMCSKCDKIFTEAGVKCSCQGVSERVTGWPNSTINKTIFNIREFLKELGTI